MVGRAIQKILPPNEHTVYLGTNDCNLLGQHRVYRLFNKFQPTHVIHLAAKVGGVHSNQKYVADFFEQNIQINTNILKVAKDFNCKVVSLLSTCVYPDAQYIDYPLTEDKLHLGPPHYSNYGYAYAKRMIEVQTRAYNEQYGTNFYCAIPNNIFGEHDNFHLEDGHVIPAIIRKIYESTRITKQPPRFWGNGTPLREFTCADDIAKALVFILTSDDDIPTTMNIGNTQEISIDRVVKLVSHYFDCPFDPIWDVDFPTGQYRKPSSNELFLRTYKNKTGTEFTYESFNESLKKVCGWFEENYPNVRGVQ